MREPIREVWVITEEDGQVLSLALDRESAIGALDCIDEHIDVPDQLLRGEEVDGITVARLPILTDEAAAVLAAVVALDDAYAAVMSFHGDYESEEYASRDARFNMAEKAFDTAMRAYRASTPEDA